MKNFQHKIQPGLFSDASISIQEKGNFHNYVDNAVTLMRKNIGNPEQKYLNLEEINAYLYGLSVDYPGQVELVVGGKTYQNRNILGVKLFGGKNRRIVVFEGGIHAREWIAPAIVLYILRQLLVSEDKGVKDLASTFEFHIFPVINADGYAYTHDEENDGDRNWRKSLSPSNNSPCLGTDLNRNFDLDWGGNLNRSIEILKKINKWSFLKFPFYSVNFYRKKKVKIRS